MSEPMPGPIRMRRAAMSLITLLGGVSLAVIPAATVSISSRLFTVQEQGVLAVAVLVATFCGQLTCAVVVESRLSSAATERRVVFPLWLAALSVVTALVLAIIPPNAIALAVGLGALVGVLAGFAGQQWALIPLVAGIAIATCVRCLPVTHRASRPEPAVMGWVVADTAITGVIYPLLNAMILAFLGSADAVLFTSISTVSGLLAIPLNFMRLRLLKEHSRLDIVVSGASVLAAVVALLVLEFTGVFGFIFGEAWTGSATLVPLLLACAWRAASLATTIPFAALRRAGEVRLVTGLRAAVSVLTFALAAVGLATQSLAAVFLGLLVAELVSAVVYEVARRRRLARGIREAEAADAADAAEAADAADSSAAADSAEAALDPGGDT